MPEEEEQQRERGNVSDGMRERVKTGVQRAEVETTRERERENGSDELDELGTEGDRMIELERGKRGISCQRKRTKEIGRSIEAENECGREGEILGKIRIVRYRLSGTKMGANYRE